MHNLVSDVPVLAILLIIAAALIVGAIAFFACRRHRRVNAARRELSSQVEDQRVQIRAKDEDIRAVLATAWEVSWEQIDLEVRLAAGGFGEVWRAQMQGTGTVAVKRLFKTVDTKFSEEQETRFLQRTRHAKLVRFIGCGRMDDGGIFLVLEFMNRGDLQSLLCGNDGSLDWQDRLSLLSDAAEGMRFLHGTGSMHRDLVRVFLLQHRRALFAPLDWAHCVLRM